MTKQTCFLMTCVLSLLNLTLVSADNISGKEISQLNETKYGENSSDEFLIPEGITWDSTMDNVKQTLNIEESDCNITNEDIESSFKVGNYVSPLIDGTCNMNISFINGRFSELRIDAFIKQPLFGYISDTVCETAYTDLANKFEDRYAGRYTCKINGPEELLAFDKYSVDNDQDAYVVNFIKTYMKPNIEAPKRDALKVWVIDKQYGIVLYRPRRGISRNMIKIIYTNPYTFTAEGRPDLSRLYALPKGFEWGDTYNTVLNKVKTHIFTERSGFIIRASPEADTYEEMAPDSVMYLFSDKGLCMIIYTLSLKPDYQKINTALSRKYGEGVAESSDEINFMFNQFAQSGDYQTTTWSLDEAILYSGYNTNNGNVFIIAMNKDMI